jgi:predicted SAM-dependent methyltransferase
MRINAGCGLTPTTGWRNFDNSISVLLSKIAFLPELLHRSKIIAEPPYRFMLFCRSHAIEYGNPVQKLPVPDGAADALYSSHMLEHLDRHEACRFLKEARRVLCSRGVIRLAVPDLRKYCEQYLVERNADKFVTDTFLCTRKPKNILDRLTALVAGPQHHLWMYDGESLRRLLASFGFLDVSVMAPGETKIKDPGPLDLRERETQSVYVEALNP